MISIFIRNRRVLEPILIAGFFACLLHEVYAAKLFARVIAPRYFRDFGILLDLATDLNQTAIYSPRFISSPTTAIYVNLLQKLGPEFAFRMHLLIEAAALVVTVLGWAIIGGILEREERGLIVVAGLLSTVFYIRFELHMHNLNLVALGLFSMAILCIARSSSGLFYAASVSVKPSGAVLLLPRMLWAERYRWVLVATVCVSRRIPIPVQRTARSRYLSESPSRMLTRPRWRLRSAVRKASAAIGRHGQLLLPLKGVLSRKRE